MTNSEAKEEVSLADKLRGNFKVYGGRGINLVTK